MENEIPIFVKIDEYKDILDTVNLVKGKIREAKELLTELHEIRIREDKEIDQWKANIEEVERKMMFVDKTLFGE